MAVTVTAVPPAPVATVVVTPATASVQPGATRQLTATLRDATGNVLTGRAIAWTSSATGVATVSATGLVTAVSAGSADVRALSEGVADTSAITVPAPPPPAPVATVVVTPATANIQAGATQQLAVVLRDAGGNVLTGRTIMWESAATGVATVSAAGLVTGVAPGSAGVRAISEGVADTSTITVTAPPPPAPVATVVVTPATASIAIGATQQLTAVLRDAGGNVLTGRAVTWESAATGVATVSATGLVTAVAAGSAGVRAISEGVADTSTITVAAAPPPAPVATVVVTPASASVQIGATRQLTAVLRDAGGNVLTGRTITWESSATGVATVSATGLVTAVAAGSAGVRAISEGVADTSAITVPAPPAPVASVELTPATATVNVGQTQQFTVTLRDAGGNVLTGRTITWQSLTNAVATISTAGLVTAVSAGTVMVLASCEGVADTSTITVPPLPPPPGGSADPSRLPLATGQTPSAGTYGRSLAAGQTYVDPLTTVTVLKLTSASVPNSNGGMYHGYSEGGPSISQPWVGTDGNTYYTAYLSDGWLVDIRFDTFATSNWRAAPSDGELTFAFSLNQSTPRVAYYVAGKTIHRYNTATNQNQDTGIFPHTIAAAGNTLLWLQVNMNDQWIVGMLNSNATVVAFRTSDGLSRAFPTSFAGGLDIDEPHIDREFPVVYISTNDEANLIVNLETGNVVAENDPGNDDSADHEASLRGRVVALSWQANGIISATHQGSVSVPITPAPSDFNGDWHMAGQWVFNNPSQYFVIDQWASNGNFKVRRGMIGFVNLAGDVRLLAAHDATGTGYDNGGQPHPTLSPDGKLVMWTSNMNGSSRHDVFVARVPTQ